MKHDLFCFAAGRIAAGSVLQLPAMNALAVYAVDSLLLGIPTITFAIWTSKIGLLFCAVLFGFGFGIDGPSWVEGVVVLTGQELSSLGTGISLVLAGAGWMIGSPLAGKHSTITTSLREQFSFHANNSCLEISP